MKIKSEECGRCGLGMIRLIPKPTPRHDQYGYCSHCNDVKTYEPIEGGWLRNTTPPKWVKEFISKK